MTTYIENIVTEVAVEPDAAEVGQEVDKRWVEIRKLEAMLKARLRQAERTRAEGFDD